MLGESKFSLSGRLLESLAGFAGSISTATVSSLASSAVAVSSASDDTAPNNFGAVIVDGDAKSL